MANYSQYWFDVESGLLYSANYKYQVQENIITGKYRIVFSGAKEWNKQAKRVRYYEQKPKDKNICLTVRSI
jgi:hypothetical protein